MTFIFGGRTKIDIKRRYRVIFKSRSLTQRGGDTGPQAQLSDDIYRFKDPSYPSDGSEGREKRDWLFVFGTGFGIKFILDNSEDKGTTGGGTGSPGFPGQIPGAGQNPVYPRPSNYYEISFHQIADWNTVLYWYTIVIVSYVRSGNGWRPVISGEGRTAFFYIITDGSPGGITGSYG